MRSDLFINGLFTGQGSPYRESFALTGETLKSSQLLDVLDLAQAGLQTVAQLHGAGDEAGALRALLQYYRERTQVAWPTWPAEQTGITTLSLEHVIKLTATEEDAHVAENAIRRIFQPYNAFPPTQYTTPIDWDWDPHGNIEWPAHMHRMSGWDLSTARCYSATRDERYASLWVELTDDWIERNPLTRARCYFPQSWDAIQVGIRSTRWSGLLPYFVCSEACTPQFLARLLAAIYNHARRSCLIRYPNRDNFAIIEAAGLADIALTFPEFCDADEWRSAAFERLSNAMQEQVLADGMHGELSPTYHLYCASLFLNVAHAAMRNQHDAPFVSGVERMFDVLMGIATPEGLLPVVGDASPSDVRPLMAKAARIFKRSDFLATATAGMDGSWPTQRNAAFEESGFYVFRSEWSADAIWMCLHCGPASIQPSAFHSQFDNGTFELMAHGEYLMRDPGVFCYARGDPQREAFRRTAAHQTLTLDDTNSKRSGRLLQWVDDDGAGNAHLTVENQSYPNLAHRRTVFFVARQYFVLVDEALGVANGTVALHYQFAPGQVVTAERKHQAYTRYAHGSNVLVWQSPDDPVVLETEEAWYSPQHNIKEPMPALRYVHAQHTLPVRFVTVIVPWRGTGLPSISTQITGQPGEDEVSVRLQVNAEMFDLRRLIKR